MLLLELLDVVQGHIDAIEKRMRETFEDTDQIRLLKTMPGVGFILGVVISLEIGDIDRFYDAPRLASYCGVTPRVHASGDKIRYGRLRPDVNRYLKWAFSEAGNSVAVNRKRYPDRHVSLLYNRIRHHRGHAKAIGAVARHLSNDCDMPPEYIYVAKPRRDDCDKPSAKDAGETICCSMN